MLLKSPQSKSGARTQKKKRHVWNDWNHCAITQRNIQVVVTHFYFSQWDRWIGAHVFIPSVNSAHRNRVCTPPASEGAATDGAPHSKDGATRSSVHILLRQSDGTTRRARVTRCWRMRVHAPASLPANSGDLRTATTRRDGARSVILYIPSVQRNSQT